jgi:hypothetical protein
VEALASNVLGQWEQATVDRKLDLPQPIPVRWTRSRRPGVGSQVAAAIGNSGQRTRFVPLPGAPPATADAVEAGDLDDLCAIYSGLGSGRMVLMGPHGSGKTATAISMVLNALNRRMSLPPDQRADTPVPILFTVHNWRPNRQTLGNWFADQLAATYRFLQSNEYGPNAASEMVRNGRVALFLDGFDEMEERHRQRALKVIAAERRTFRLVVLTRVDEFSTAVQEGHLPGAVVLELSPTSPGDVAHYLRSLLSDPPKDGDELLPLIDHVEHHPDSHVTQALDTPLNLSLIRDDPAVIEHLLTPGRFQSRDEIEDTLLERVVPVAYRSKQIPGHEPGPTVEEAERWLGYVAAHMNARHTRDLAWWHMHHWAHVRWRGLADILAGIIAMGCIGALVFGPIGLYTVDGHTGTVFGILYGGGMGALFGLVAAAVSEIRALDPDRPGWRWSAPLRGTGWLTRFNPALGLLIGLAVTMAVGNQSTYLFGVPAGILAGFCAGRAAARTRLVAPATRFRWTLPRPSRADLVSAVTAGLPIGLAYGFTKTPSSGIVAALVTAFTFGLMVSVSRPVANADIPADPLISWRADRRRGLLIGLAAGIPLGLALGIQNGRAHGLPAGVVAAVGLGSMIAMGCMVGTCDSWRTTLLFAQLCWRRMFPLFGMRFLDDARAREILRTNGPYLQFRHARLQDELAKKSPRTSSRPNKEMLDSRE